ncbi:hypothetical protein PCANC_03753 [Puccinia coronata f. sp. avenae]|uniref:Uncharacterized protein n=1 Tax=Puccinia coronata f. sp. avenae TaxID=200324 RepID=A0A2N5VVC1_9BASI|nr:hypothetical protein PCANC_03753 [Puccinia coronata f. sp. avenae]
MLVYASMTLALWVEFPASAGTHLPAFPRTCLPSRLCILLSKLAATCSASRLQPALQAGCNLLSKQAATCSPSRLQPALQAGCNLLSKQAATCSPSRLQPALQAGCNLLSKQAATCSPSRLQPACQAPAGCNLLAKQAETCLPARLQAAGGGQVRFPGNRTGASHSKSWLKSNSPGIGLGGCQQRQRLLSSSSPQKQQRPLAAALGPRQRPLLSRVRCQPQQLPSCCFCGWLQSDPRGIGQTGARDRSSNMVPSVAGQSRLLSDPRGIGLEPAKAGTTLLLLWLAPV